MDQVQAKVDVEIWPPTSNRLATARNMNMLFQIIRPILNIVLFRFDCCPTIFPAQNKHTYELI